MTPRQKRVLAAIEAIELASPTNQITPRALWESARDESHPLHGEFEWDDEVAGAAWRDEQARRLLRLRITTQYEERVFSDVPICVRTPESPPGVQGYTRTVKIMDDKAQARATMLEEFDRAKRAIERASRVADALGFTSEFQTLLSTMTKLAKTIKAA